MANDTNASALLNVTRDSDSSKQSDFVRGVILAVSSSILIGSSYIIKKKGLLRVSNRDDRASRAGSGGYGYLKDWVWWLGFITMGLGELSNFVAYGFAPASVVTPLGALSVLFAAVLSSYILKEKLNLFGKLGCFIAIIGSTLIVIHAPADVPVNSLQALSKMLLSPGFIVYVCFVIVFCLILIFILQPRYGKKNMIVYIATCSLIGSLSVMACKGVSIGIKQTFTGDSQLGKFVFWLLIVVVVVCIVFQMNYLNKALDIFNTALVTPVYYVMFTTFTIIASAILFKEWELLSVIDAIGLVCGFLTIIVGVFMLHAFRNLKFSRQDLPTFEKVNSDRPLEMTNVNEENEKMINDWDSDSPARSQEEVENDI